MYVSLQTHSLSLIRKLSRLLRTVAHNPAAEPVHRLRTTVRRLEAVLDAQYEENHGKLRKHLRTLRREAGRVRDLDIQLAVLKTVRPDGHPEQKEAVSQRLAAQRTSREKKLVALLNDETIAAVRKRLNRLAAELRQAGTTADAAPALRDPIMVALDQFAELNTTYASLSAENLHDFRTQTKQIRYLAETGAAQPDGELVVRELKRAQDAMGAWHDLAELHRKAAKVLAETPHAVLVAVLRTMRESSYSQAVRAVGEVRDALRALRSARQKRSPRPARASVVRARTATG